MKNRLDLELVARGLARSRSHAKQMLTAGMVSVAGQICLKPNTQVSSDTEISAKTDPWVSRAAQKLIPALAQSGIIVPPRVLDAGASTGGFTQVCLNQGAKRIYAVDVGHDQLAEKLKNLPEIVNLEGLNLRDLTLEHVENQPVDLAVGDVSFISLTLIMEPIFNVLSPSATALLLVKPQFEVGKNKLTTSGVVREEKDRLAAVDKIIDHGKKLGWHPIWRQQSVILGAGGNAEYFVAFKKTN